jgi:hypothetical protein
VNYGLDAFFNPIEFGQEGVYLPPTGAGRVCHGILEWGDVEAGGDVVSRRPFWVTKTSCVPGAFRDYSLKVGAQLFKITQHLQDGTGISRLVLQTDAC